MSKDETPVLRIRAGLHLGARVRLSAGTYVIGSAPTCDIVLFDPGVAPRHVSLACESGRVVATPLHGAPLRIDAQAHASEPLLLCAGVPVQLGEAELELEGARVPRDRAEDGVPEVHRRLATGWKLSVTGLFGLCIAGAMLSTGRSAASASARGAAPLAAQVRTPARIDSLAARVREFVTDDALRIEKTRGDGIRVSGRTNHATVKPQLQRLTKEFAGRVEIVDAVDYVPLNAEPKSIRMPVAITDVHLDTPPWFGTRDGRKYFEGSQWDGTVVVERITFDGILFSRGKEILVYRFDDGGT